MWWLYCVWLDRVDDKRRVIRFFFFYYYPSIIRPMRLYIFFFFFIIIIFVLWIPIFHHCTLIFFLFLFIRHSIIEIRITQKHKRVEICSHFSKYSTYGNAFGAYLYKNNIMCMHICVFTYNVLLLSAYSCSAVRPYCFVCQPFCSFRVYASVLTKNMF